MGLDSRVTEQMTDLPVGQISSLLDFQSSNRAASARGVDQRQLHHAIVAVEPTFIYERELLF
jgi:hypothetical protein